MSNRDFDDFYREVRSSCLQALYVTVSDLHEAEDLLAEAFTRAFKSWSDVRNHPAPSAWVVRTALNLHTDNWRKKRYGRSRQHLVAVGQIHEDKITMVDPSLLQSLKALPEQQLQVVIHRVLLDLSTQQTSQILGISEGTVSVHLKRGLASIRELLRQQEEQEYTK